MTTSTQLLRKYYYYYKAKQETAVPCCGCIDGFVVTLSFDRPVLKEEEQGRAIHFQTTQKKTFGFSRRAYVAVQCGVSFKLEE